MAVINTETRDPLSDKLPADFAEQSQRIVNNAFRLLAEQTQQLANDIAEFNQRRNDTKERIRRGARRTTRRVV
jgi:hypothetical protein